MNCWTMINEQVEKLTSCISLYIQLQSMKLILKYQLYHAVQYDIDDATTIIISTNLCGSFYMILHSVYVQLNIVKSSQYRVDLKVVIPPCRGGVVVMIKQLYHHTILLLQLYTDLCDSYYYCICCIAIYTMYSPRQS